MSIATNPVSPTTVRSIVSQISARVIGERRAFPIRQLIVRIVRRLRHCVWQPRPRKPSTRTVSPPGVVVS